MILLFITLLFVSSGTLAVENTNLIKCELPYKGEFIELILDKDGQSFLRYPGPSINTKFQIDYCDIKLTHISGSPRRQIPGYSLRWNVGDCQGKMLAVKTDMLQHIYMNIDMLSTKPVGNVQWLHDKDVEQCVLSEFRAEEIQRGLDERRK